MSTPLNAQIHRHRDGSIVMTVDDSVYVAKRGKDVPKLIKQIEKKHHKRPLITVVPKEDTLILMLL